MSGKPDWTPETMLTLIQELGKRLDERHQTQQEEIRAGDEELRRHFDQRITDAYVARKQRDHMLDERYETQTKAVDKALQAQITAMQTAFQAADKAVDTARKADQEAVDKALTAAEKAVDRRQDQADKEFHEHLEQVRHENMLALESADKLVNERFDSNDKAITKAEVANEKRFEGVNEFRAQLNDQTQTFMPREVADATFKELRSKIESLQTANSEASGRGAGIRTSGGALGASIAALAALVVIVNVLIAYAR